MNEENKNFDPNKNMPDGTEDIHMPPKIKHEDVYDVTYFGRADMMTALYTLIAQSWLPYVVVDISYMDMEDPSAPPTVRISKGYNRQGPNDPDWDQSVSCGRKIIQIKCRFFKNIDSPDSFLDVSFSYYDELKNNGKPMLHVDMRQAENPEEFQSKLFGILTTAVAN